MKPQHARELIKNIKERGWIEVGSKFYPPNSIEAKNHIKKKNAKKKIIKTGDIHDTRNINNKLRIKDPFIQVVNMELNVDVWPEFYFSSERLWRFDYCIPDFKIFIEVEGGIWTGGRHTRPQGFINDIEKYNCATSLGWKMIRTTPSLLISNKTLEQIKTFLK